MVRVRHHRMSIVPGLLDWILFEWFFYNFIYFYIFYALWSQRFTDFFLKFSSNDFGVCPQINFYLTFHISKFAYFKILSKKFLKSRCCIRFPHIRVLFQIKYAFVFVLKCNDSINFFFCFNLLNIGYYNADV